MAADIVTLEDCASNYGIFKVPSSKGNKTYDVHFHGSEQQAFCDCKGFQFHAGQCSHIKRVWKEACMYNPQWHDGQKNPKLQPIGFTFQGFSKNKCPACGGKMIFVRRAV